ncbi:sulfite exporter TauE/SafE family protein [Desulfosporosinus sp. FKB]|uniref:nickel/cobalt transporter n=1 Tax=Desulfosporosinus sp. FKB TaxID=1969835 RepID=UPI000B4A13B5|nr:sulfite exporter TauE/SafE family protein [Desulfosporosinus sp. FKB]
MDLSYTFPIVLGLGALHSLEPGHGKGIITAYLVTTGAKVKDAVMIGLISAMAHTLSIVLLVISTSSALKVIMPQNLTYWIQLLSGVVVIYIGLDMIVKRFFPNNDTNNGCCHHHIGHHYQKDCNHDEPISLKKRASLRNLFLMGFFIGLVPCPSALAILLAAVSADRIPLGLGLVAAFSIGSALTMVTIGLLVVKASSTFKRLERGRVIDNLSMVSSLLILFLGAAVMLQSIYHI